MRTMFLRSMVFNAFISHSKEDANSRSDSTSDNENGTQSGSISFNPIISEHKMRCWWSSGSTTHDAVSNWSGEDTATAHRIENDRLVETKDYHSTAYLE